MSEKKYTWHKIAESLNELQFGENNITIVEIPGKRMCVAVQNDKLYACATTCPHSGGMLALGHLDAVGNIVCPLHKYKFSLRNGHNVSGEGYFLKTYPVEQRPDGIFIGIEVRGILSWLK